MKLYSIYKTCKEVLFLLEKCRVESVVTYNEFQITVEGWNYFASSFEMLRELKIFDEEIDKIIEIIPSEYMSLDNWEVESNESTMVDCIDALRHGVNTIVKMYESFGYSKQEIGIDIKMPEGDFSAFVNNVKTIEFILTQCPTLKVTDAEIKFNNVDVGSTWLTFVVIGSGAIILLNNIASLIDKAIMLRSRLISVKQHEELLRTMQVKNEFAERMINDFNDYKKEIMNHMLRKLETDEIQYKDGEERDKEKLALEKMVDLLNKGMEFYASIDTPNEVQALFPTVSEQKVISSKNTMLLPTDKEE